jgi:hypothetical protein
MMEKKFHAAVFWGCEGCRRGLRRPHNSPLSRFPPSPYPHPLNQPAKGRVTTVLCVLWGIGGIAPDARPAAYAFAERFSRGATYLLPLTLFAL